MEKKIVNCPSPPFFNVEWFRTDYADGSYSWTAGIRIWNFMLGGTWWFIDGTG